MQSKNSFGINGTKLKTPKRKPSTQVRKKKPLKTKKQVKRQKKKSKQPQTTRITKQQKNQPAKRLNTAKSQRENQNPMRTSLYDGIRNGKDWKKASKQQKEKEKETFRLGTGYEAGFCVMDKPQKPKPKKLQLEKNTFKKDKADKWIQPKKMQELKKDLQEKTSTFSMIPVQMRKPFIKHYPIGFYSGFSINFDHLEELRDKHNVDMFSCKIHRIDMLDTFTGGGIVKCGIQVWYQHKKTKQIYQTERKYGLDTYNQNKISLQLHEEEDIVAAEANMGVVNQVEIFNGLKLLSAYGQQVLTNKAGGFTQQYDIPVNYKICGFYGAIDGGDMFLNNLGLYLMYSSL